MIGAAMLARVRAFRPSYSMVFFTSTVLTVVVLFGVRAYFAEYGTVANRTLLQSGGVDAALFRAQAKENLSTGSMPIARAMQTLASAGRNAPTIEPRRSTDPAPAAGWMHHPDYEAPPVLEEPAPQPELEQPIPMEAPGEAPEAAPAPAAPLAPTAAPAAARPPAAPTPAAPTTAAPTMAAPTMAAAADTPTMAPAAPTAMAPAGATAMTPPAAPAMAPATMAPAAAGAEQ